MKNLWPDKFEENQQPTAKSILEEQAKLLSTITDGVVLAEVSQLNAIDAIRKSMSDSDFAFRFDIIGKFLENYRFNVFCFSHDITLYPVKVVLDDGIAKEMNIKRTLGDYIIELGSPNQLESFLGNVLNSKRMKNIVGSIIRLSH